MNRAPPDPRTLFEAAATVDSLYILWHPYGFHMERSILDVHGSLQVTIPSELAAKYGWRAGDKVDFLDAGNGLNLALARERTVFTIGYEGQDVSHLTSALKKQGIKQLLDVREKPISRKPGFTKRRLKEALELAGIAYIHLPELGSPSAVRHDLKAGGTFEKFEKEYAWRRKKTC
jgi:uncharacterized protein (DUF488 family)